MLANVDCLVVDVNPLFIINSFKEAHFWNQFCPPEVMLVTDGGMQTLVIPLPYKIVFPIVVIVFGKETCFIDVVPDKQLSRKELLPEKPGIDVTIETVINFKE